MENFIFQNSTKIIFGKNTEKMVGSEIAKFSRKILLHYGGGSIKKNGLYEKIVHSLGKENIQYIELPGVKPNPRLSLLKEGIKICKDNQIDFILAVGGGSVIDSAKGIALGVKYQGDVWDFYGTDKNVEEVIPIGAVLTIPAAGSETSRGSIITNIETQYKRSCNSTKLRPVFAILNPELTFTLPSYQTACGAADIISHVTERYFSNTENTGLIDRLSESLIKTICENVPIALKNPTDYSSRAEIMWAGTIAHNELLGTGKICDWGSHHIEHEISGIYDIAHGAGLAIIIPAWMKYVYKVNIDKFVQFAVRVFNIEQNFRLKEETAIRGIESLEMFFKNIGLPTTFKEAGIGSENFDIIAKRCTEKGPRGNFKKLYREDVLNILEMAQ